MRIRAAVAIGWVFVGTHFAAFGVMPPGPGAPPVGVGAAVMRAAAAGRPAIVTAGQNLPPAITSLAIQSPRLNAPPDFADITDDVAVSATVTDAETPIGQLTFEWSADLGTFTGSGPAVRWRAPAAVATPRAVTITVRVSETAGVLDGKGGVKASTLAASRRATLSLHDSPKEIAEMSRQFLLDFSDSTLAPGYVVRDFWDGCPGKALELSDVIENRKNYLIRSHAVGEPAMIEVNFQGTCAFNSESGDGCAAVPWEWHDTYLPTGESGTTIGTEYLSAVYRDNRWWLCSSGFKRAQTPAPARFIR